jgi:ubiquinone biosynthesis protein UbiJ
MATPSPLLMLEDFLQNLPLPKFRPPVWAVEEAQRRIVSLLNHILSQEKEATGRLARQQGRVVLLQWRQFSMRFILSPAGLLDLAVDEARPDLVLALTDDSPSALVQWVMRGDRPVVRIEGDVQLAAEVNWVVDHVRWDIEEDLARVVGDAPAHSLGQAARAMIKALRQFIGATVTDAGKASA